MARLQIANVNLKARTKWKKGNPPAVCGLYLCKLDNGRLTALRIFPELKNGELMYEDQCYIDKFEKLQNVKEYIGPFKDKVGRI